MMTLLLPSEKIESKGVKIKYNEILVNIIGAIIS